MHGHHAVSSRRASRAAAPDRAYLTPGKEEHRMCGIFGYAGSSSDAADIVLSGLRLLEYRGYDSWGIAVAHEDGMAVEKRVGKIGDATTALPRSALGIGHT
ncbi:MAG: hypothetical protein ACREKS_20395, partial [Candidatus Rokuibacteriota bacterium]